MKSFSKLCTPAKLYFAIAVISAIFGLFNGIPVIFALMKLVFAIIWSVILGWLCKKGFTPISWFLVLLPYIIIALAMLDIYHVTHEHKQLMKTVKLQGAYGQDFIEGMSSIQKAATIAFKTLMYGMLALLGGAVLYMLYMFLSIELGSRWGFSPPQ